MYSIHTRVHIHIHTYTYTHTFYRIILTSRHNASDLIDDRGRRIDRRILEEGSGSRSFLREESCVVRCNRTYLVFIDVSPVPAFDISTDIVSGNAE